MVDEERAQIKLEPEPPENLKHLAKEKAKKPKKPKKDGPVVILTPTCGPADGFPVHLDVTGFPPNEEGSFELLAPDGSRLFLGGGRTDVDGNGYEGGGLEGWFGMPTPYPIPPGVYTFRVWFPPDATNASIEASATITVPCP